MLLTTRGIIYINKNASPQLSPEHTLLLRLQRSRPLDVCVAEAESSKERGTTERDTYNETLTETSDVGLKHSLEELRWNQGLEFGSTGIQDDLGIKTRRCDGQLLEKRVLERSLGGRNAESATEGLDDCSGD